MTLNTALQISLVLFMVGNLLDMGLLLKLQEAIRALRDVRFVTLSLLWGFILLPGLAYLLTVVVPLDPPYCHRARFACNGAVCAVPPADGG